MCLIAHVAAAQSDVVVKTYPVYASQPDALVEALKDLLSPKAKVVFFKSGRQIIVTGPASDQELAAALFKDINVPSRNVRMDVIIRQEGATSDSEASLTGSGKVQMTKMGTSYPVNQKPTLKNQSGAESDNALQTLVVQNGAEGRIFVGADVPFADWLIAMGQQWGYAEQNFKFRPVGSSLVVQPQITGGGGLITVTLTPELSCLEEGSGKLERVRYTRVATQVTIADGATIDLGGVGKDKEFYNKFLVGVARGGESRSVQIQLTAHIQGLQGKTE